MKLKTGYVLALSCVAVVTACSSMKKSEYWKRTDYESALYLTGARGVEQLHQDIASCTNEIDKMVKLNSLRERTPPDTNGGVNGNSPLAYYDTPTRMGEAKTSHTNFQDFEGCMRSAGWSRQSFVRPQTMMKAENTFQDVQSVRQTGMTRNERHSAELAALQARQNALVKTGGQLSFGVQAYRDSYNEPDIDVNTSAEYWGGEVSYTKRDETHFFWTIEGRAALGYQDYHSPSGILNGIDEQEGELRALVGRDYAWGNGWISPYIGLGLRSYRMLGKGLVSSLGLFAYDRRIDQLYIPIGATWRTLLLGSWPLSTTLEIDPLLVGQVNSRLQNAGGPNIVNSQSPGTGVGFRGDMMLGVPVKSAKIEVGPFFRYWVVDDSDIRIISCGGGTCIGALEPYNTRFQGGMAMRVVF